MGRRWDVVQTSKEAEHVQNNARLGLVTRGGGP